MWGLFRRKKKEEIIPELKKEKKEEDLSPYNMEVKRVRIKKINIKE